MKPYVIALCLYLGLCLSPAQADDHALAMHGAPKYADDFEHLDYVNPTAPKGGTLRQGVNGSFDTLHDQIIKGTAVEGLELVYDKLMQRVWDEPFTLYGLVAESIEIPDDRSMIIYTLNKQAKFHDGKPITTDDVIFTYEMLRKHGHPVRRRVYGLVEGVERLSDHKVLFKFGDGYDAETALILSIMPILPKHHWKGKDFTQTTMTPPLGSGPYKIKEVKPGRQIVYERVTDYWAKDLPINVGHHNFDTIIFDYYRDDGVALEAFKAGEYDFRREWDPTKWQAGYKSVSPQINREEIKHGRPEWARSLIFNTRRAPFDNAQVREALNHAFDFDWINKNLFYGMYRRNESFFPNSELAAQGVPEHEELNLLKQHVPELSGKSAWAAPVGSNRDRLRRADALLTEAGWIVKEGRRVNAETETLLEFEILLSDPGDEKIVLNFSQNLKRLGIGARIRTVDSAQFTQRLDRFDYDMVLFRWINSLSPGNEQLNYWGSDAADLDGSRNYAGVKSAAVDVIADSIARAPDRESLVARTRTLDRLLTWNHYTIPLYHLGKDLVAYWDHLARPETTPVYGIVLETWWSPKQ